VNDISKKNSKLTPAPPGKDLAVSPSEMFLRSMKLIRTSFASGNYWEEGGGRLKAL